MILAAYHVSAVEFWIGFALFLGSIVVWYLNREKD